MPIITIPPIKRLSITLDRTPAGLLTTSALPVTIGSQIIPAAASLTGLSDVDITTLVDGGVLFYNQHDEKFEFTLEPVFLEQFNVLDGGGF